MNSGTLLLVSMLIGVWSLFLLIGIGSARWVARGSFARLFRPRQYELVAGAMHREPVYPGEDDPIQPDVHDEAVTS
jgi:hypothetical protein